MTHDLPPLPAADRIMWQYGQQIDHYSPAQMRAYAAEAVRLARLQALEDAALACGSVKTTRFDQARGARLCVDAINALKDRA